MDMNEASAMTEASGLTDEQGGLGRPYSAVERDAWDHGREGNPADLAGPAVRLATRLRKVTVESPLQSLLRVSARYLVCAPPVEGCR